MFYAIIEKVSEIGLSLIQSVGYPGIFLVSFLENVFTPIPSEAIIPFAGILVSQGQFNLVLVVLAATIGSIVGAYVFYGLGYWMGSERFRAFIIKWGKYIFVSESDVDRAEEWFEKYEDWAVLICRVIPLVRSFISIPAGYVKMPLLKFTVLTGIGTAVWSTFLVYLGIIYGDNYETITPLFRKGDIVVAGILAVVVVVFLYKKLKSRRSTQNT
ncbi:DedA family protein [candidate division WWE3 bacterium]|uniref:DedA family protein n=1 Tax=candidate division WWE3 bacterium TaxID=2053526 RepID=A0A955LL07_UNCKA|nr:DedA family protein [candidate division WWE3 bacterium]